jgi:nucleoside-diphosphate-sugar epimerase
MYLVTGGAGFIGSHLVEALLEKGERVRVLDDFSTGSWENLAPFVGAVEVIEGDIVDLTTVSRAMEGVRFVLHHAAIASVERSVHDPKRVHQVNVDGTLNILLAAREAQLERLVFASSAAVYGDADRLPLGEDTPSRALSPYAATKVAGEAYVRAFAVTYALPATILRYFNVYGPGQDPISPYSGVITKFVMAVHRGESPTIFGDGHQTRDFVYVGDVVRANLRACAGPEAVGKTLNVAGGRQMSILRLSEMLNDVMGRQLTPRFAPPLLGEVRHSGADISLAQRLLGWRPETELEVGLAQTAGWLTATSRG